MADSMAFWLVVTNLALAAVVVFCGVIVFGAIIHAVADTFRRCRRLREVERDWRGIFGDGGPVEPDNAEPRSTRCGP